MVLEPEFQMGTPRRTRIRRLASDPRLDGLAAQARCCCSSLTRRQYGRRTCAARTGAAPGLWFPEAGVSVGCGGVSTGPPLVPSPTALGALGDRDRLSQAPGTGQTRLSPWSAAVQQPPHTWRFRAKSLNCRGLWMGNSGKTGAAGPLQLLERTEVTW
uniref:Uncharacterized protein n=1 Tax=Mustela putorius furo TaxID=9669 RepID=M3YAP0_MUSPF